MKKLLLLPYLFCLLSQVQAQVSFNGGTGTITDNQTWLSFPCTVNGLNPANINTNYGFEKLTLSINHNNVSDLEIHLVAPDGTDVLILNNVGGNGNNFTNTGFKNNYTTPIASGTAPFNGSYKPEGDLGLFNNGQIGDGTWYLRVRDNSNNFQGTVVSWSIRFGYGPAIPYTQTSFSTNLPIVKINTGDSSIPDDPKMPVWFQVINNPSGINKITDTAYEYEGVIGIEQRGSSSGSADKKSYGFETWDANYNEIDTPILGMPAQSDWILSASYYDKTLMRNVLSYKLFNDMSHYASRTQYCELYLDGEYMGIYILMEKIKRDNNRVDIAKLRDIDINGDDLTGGYIIKIDKFTGSGGAGFGSNYPPSNPNGDGIYYQYEYPSPDSIMPQQEAYIARYIDSFETALFGANYQDPINGFRRYAGERTFMDFMFLNEISKNVDGYRLSTYFYKDKYSKGGKLKAGPAWDYDIGWMNANYCQAEIDTGWAYNLSYVCPGAAVPAHWERMMSDPLFRQRVRCRWASLRQTVLHTDTILTYIDSTVAYINAAQQRNFVTWPILGQATWPQPNPIPQNYAEEIQRLKTWINGRLAWLDSKIYTFPILNLQVDMGADTSLCSGDIVKLNGGNFDHYQWSNGLSSSSINVSASGTYNVTVSDDFGCRGTDNIIVNVDPIPQVQLGNDTTICIGSNVVLDAGLHNSYTWSNGESNQQVSVNQTGNYTVTVSDNNNCTATDDIMVNVQALPDASFSINAQGNTIYQFNTSMHGSHVWNFGDGNTSNAENPTHDYGNATGTFDVTHTVTDTIGCTASHTEAISLQGVGIADIAASNIRIYPNPTQHLLNVEVQNSTLYNIEVTDLMGKQLYSNQANGKASIDMLAYPVGTYLIQIRNADIFYTTRVVKQ